MICVFNRAFCILDRCWGTRIFAGTSFFFLNVDTFFGYYIGEVCRVEGLSNIVNR